MTTLAALSLHFPFVWYGFLLLFGLALGSFYNVVIYRLPRMLTQTADDERITLSTPGSSCPQCRQPISLAGQYPAAQFPLAGPSRPLLSGAHRVELSADRAGHRPAVYPRRSFAGAGPAAGGRPGAALVPADTGAD
ncbi:prepilin peptidase [Klebsiella pneumoniae]|nr:prepilin peptidase [Klebsiella pneumoniae]